MRLPPSLILTVFAALGFAAGGAAADGPRLELSDDKLPLLEVRPLDRRVYLLTLDGKWNQPPTPGVSYYVNLLFPNGQAYDHRPLDDRAFRLGEVRCVIQDYLLKRSGLAGGGQLSVVVSAGRPVASASAAEVVSNVLQVSWPMDRPIVLKPPQSRFSPPGPVDAFPPGPSELPPPKPAFPLPPTPGVPPAAEPVPPPKPADS